LGGWRRIVKDDLVKSSEIFCKEFSKEWEDNKIHPTSSEVQLSLLMIQKAL
jgi:hypothetical protein